jgi:hypothetical protein
MQNPLAPVARWWRNWAATRASLESLRRCGPEEAERLARDLGISTPELRVLASKWPDAADLLNRRLAALMIDAAEIRRIEPQVLTDLQRVCTMCVNGRECRHDLDRNPSDPAWRQYCPNVATLDAVVAERTRGNRTR